jgi:SAM-dependent methyltransferase
MTASAGHRYAFDNDDRAATDRHRYLSAMLDEFTFGRLADLGDLTGRRCLELGAGGGSVAAWLATRAGPTGQVTATDINTRHLRPDQGYRVLRHNLVTEPLPDGPWDVIHARLLLIHLPERHEVLSRLAHALAPGGALLIEEFDTAVAAPLLHTDEPELAELFEIYHRLLVERILPAAGNDPTWARRVHTRMLTAGLVDVDTVVHARSWPGGTAGALLVAANLAQVREDLLAAGMTPRQLDRLDRLVRSPGAVVRGHFTYSTCGRRPAD